MCQEPLHCKAWLTCATIASQVTWYGVEIGPRAENGNTPEDRKLPTARKGDKKGPELVKQWKSPDIPWPWAIFQVPAFDHLTFGFRGFVYILCQAT